ncbi:nephrin-like isoform X2 [Eriocheir sinensis]|uniref:nephrin-like isoform X2 n=1 Tax=Eriocheir sinensis TaxID=95602 RepID=UPI0021C96B55|nr:nephrin-like isoform X2 [Eriocheir sinensis]
MAVVGRAVKIPCRVHTTQTDKIVFVIWSKSGETNPVVSVDMRYDPPQEYAYESVFGSRAKFHFKEGMSYLMVEDVRVEDAGRYTCSMEIQQKRTQNAHSTLNVIVPPGDPVIFDEDGVEVDHTLGPYNEDATVNVTCQVEGGQPSPRVTWYSKEQLLDEETERRDDQVVRNIVRLGPLTRQDLGAKYLCLALNSMLVGPRSKEVTLEMNLKPLTLTMTRHKSPLVVGREYDVTCVSRESLPPANISWWLLGRQLPEDLIFNVWDGNVTTSTLHLRPEVRHAGELLRCQAESPVIAHKALVESWPLDIHYAPNVTLELGPDLDLHDVQEGENVILVCKVDAIPKVSNVTWYRKLLEVDYDASGVVRSGNELQLTNVTRRQSGSYTCHAANEVGLGRSQPIVLNVMYVPFCKAKEKVFRGAAKHDDIKLECNVKGSPGNITFSWFYRTANGSMRIPEEEYHTQDLTSVLTYRVLNDSYYRDVLCYGENAVGRMREPCHFEVIPAGKPDPLDNCTVNNQTTEALFVSCLPGYDGGLTQRFVVQVFEDVEGIRLNINNFTESEEPRFTVDALRAGAEYLLYIYAENVKGKSDNRIIHGFTLPAEGRPVLGVLIGVVGALVIVAVVVVVVMKLKGESRRDKILRHVAAEGVKLPQAPPRHTPKDGEERPDVILCGEDTTYENVDSIPPKLKHANIYETVPYDKEKGGNNENAEKDDVEYAELTFNNGRNKNKSNKRGGGGPGGANGVIRTADTSPIYATIDHTRTAQQQQQQPLNPPPPPQHHQPQQATSKQGGKQKKQVYIPQAGGKTGKQIAGECDPQPSREPDEIPLMDAALESSV